MHCAGGKLMPATQDEGEQSGKKGKPKMSRKERLQKRRDEKRAARQAGSDEEDLDQGQFCCMKALAASMNFCMYNFDH